MISFSNAKINIGLHVLDKRPDGYHNIESILYPIPLYDVLEILPSDQLEFNEYGIPCNSSSDQNLILKAFRLIQGRYDIPNIDIQLIKRIPIGSGLGGGSSNAAFTIKILNQLFNLGLDQKELKELALEIGSDCPFFIENKPQFVSGRGEILEPIELILKDKWVGLYLPDINQSTAEAFQKVEPNNRPLNKKRIKESIPAWSDDFENDFETPFLNRFKEIQTDFNVIKENALFASLSGTGSTFYGIFDKPMQLHTSYKIQWIQLEF